MQHLFVYGTLQFDEIIQKLSGKTFSSKPAIILGFRRHKVSGCDYPAIVSSVNSKVVGKILINVDPATMQILEAFEGSEYKKVKEIVEVENTEILATVFVWKKSTKYLEDKDWNENEFKKSLFWLGFIKNE